MRKLSIALKYAIFAVIATLSNIGVQRISLLIYERKYSLYIAMFFGTLFGLGIKYILDKKFIFFYKPDTMKDDLFKFILYLLMGVVTTLIFWGCELLFDRFSFKHARFLGAAVGLSLGYTAKYFLDKHFVFRPGFQGVSKEPSA